MPWDRIEPRGSMQTQGERKRILLEELWRGRIHTDPQAIELASLHVRQAWDSIWEPTERMRSRLSGLPEGLLSLWVSSRRGHLVLTYEPSRYAPGLQPWRGQELDGICYISVDDVLQDSYAALSALGDLMDHLLGSGAAPGGAWLADGEGTTPRVSQLASRLVRLYALGYATPDGTHATPRGYFSHTWALYMTDPAGLNTLDPLAYRLYRHALMSQSWWDGESAGDEQASPVQPDISPTKS